MLIQYEMTAIPLYLSAGLQGGRKGSGGAVGGRSEGIDARNSLLKNG